MKKEWAIRLLILLLIALAIAAQSLGYLDVLSLERLKESQADLLLYYADHSLGAAVLYVAIYIVSTTVSIPGAAILTLAGGAIFGFWYGMLLVSFASTIGATFAFLGSRFLFRDFFAKKFSERMAGINQGLEKEGAFYLFSLRLVPVFPFFLVNLVMGLTSIRVTTFFFVSQLGMLPGTAAYVNAGTQLAQINSLQGILSPALLFSFVLIGLLPLVLKWVVHRFSRKGKRPIFKKPKKFDYNMVVIGGGSAGLVSAYIASAVRAKVALVEKDKMGGDCLNTGCVPSKALIRSAKIFHYFQRAREFGFTALPATVNFAEIMERVQRVVNEVAPHDSVDRYTELGVECFTGEAEILSPYEVKVGDKLLRTKNIVVATGASPLVPEIPGLRDVAYLTSETIWKLKELPKRLVVLGGGAIGCELAQCFARFGSKASLVEMAPRILGKEDGDVSHFLTERFEREGIAVLTGHRALRVDASTKSLHCEFNGKEVSIPFDEIFVALGRKANVEGFGLEKLGIEISKRGTVVADEFLRTTNYSNIYVCGDVTGPFQFTHTASHQAWYAAVNALFSPFKKFKVDYRVIPWCTFTDPEVARVGISELEAKERGISVEVTRYEISDLDRAIADGEAHGFVKVLTPPGSDKILGATIVGAHAGDVIAEYVAAMKYGFGLNKILGTIHIYPTLAEANKYAAGTWKRNNAPKTALKLLQIFHSWRRG